MCDRDNYIRLERAAIFRGKGLFHYVNFESRHHANLEKSTGTAVDEGLITLRLERKGAHVTASFRVDGHEWTTIPGWVGVYSWGPPLQVGVAAINTSTAPLCARLRDLRVQTVVK